MEAVILAGGFGTRLKPCVDNLPKPLAPIDGKPFLCYILDWLKLNGVSRAVISTGYLAEAVEAALGKSYNGIEIDYSVEETPLGTGGGIKKALRHCTQQDVVVCNGDSFFDVDLSLMKKLHSESGFPITLAARFIKNAFRSGLLEISGNKLCGFSENGVAESGYINGGVYFIKRNLLENKQGDKFSFEKDILADKRNDIGVFISEGYFIDIGIPEAYRLAQEEKHMLISKKA